jgi:uncharacterized protein
MPLRLETTYGAPCWVDLFTADTSRAKEFYGSVFGWTAEDSGEEFGGYINFSKDGHRVAGCMKNDGSSGMPDVWSIYLATNDAERTVADSASHGGQVIVPAMAVGDLGSMAVMADPGGAAIGAWQPGFHTGFGIIAEPGAPSWFELHTRDYDASVQFYRDVFGWDAKAMSDAPEFRYTTLGEGESAMAGIMDAASFLPEGVPANWQIYFGVADADAALTQIVQLGGTIIQAAEDTPFGRLAQVADPTGALFKIVAGR